MEFNFSVPIKGIKDFTIEADSLEEAIYAYTMGSAIAGSQEAQLGSIEKGKFADFIILSDIQPEATQILQTYIAGNRIH